MSEAIISIFLSGSFYGLLIGLGIGFSVEMKDNKRSNLKEI